MRNLYNFSSFFFLKKNRPVSVGPLEASFPIFPSFLSSFFFSLFFSFSFSWIMFFFSFFLKKVFLSFLLFQHLYQGLAKDVSSVVGAPWRCGVLKA